MSVKLQESVELLMSGAEEDNEYWMEEEDVRGSDVYICEASRSRLRP